MVEYSAEEGVRHLVDCAGITSEEKVLIMTDTGMDQNVVMLFADEVRKLGGDGVVALMDPRVGKSAPPEHVGAAIESSDVVIELTSVFVQHSEVRQSAQRAGLRYLFIGDIDKEMLESPGAVYADFEDIAPRIRAMSDRITDGSTMRITTDKGTDMEFDLVGRNGRALTGLARNLSEFGAPPCLEGGVVPKPEGSRGRVVADAYGVELGLLSEPITVEVEDGKATKISGAQQAAQLERILQDAQNENAWNVAEVGIGFNDQAEMIDNVTSAESVYGTAHVALGSTPADLDIEMISAGVHIDLVFWRPTIEIDGEVVMKEGESLLRSLPIDVES